MTSPDVPQVLRLFQKAAPASFFQQLCAENEYDFRQGVYNIAVVVWLMIWQRLQGNRSLAAAVQCLIQGGAGDLVATANDGARTKSPERPAAIVKHGKDCRH